MQVRSFKVKAHMKEEEPRKRDNNKKTERANYQQNRARSRQNGSGDKSLNLEILERAQRLRTPSAIHNIPQKSCIPGKIRKVLHRKLCDTAFTHQNGTTENSPPSHAKQIDRQNVKTPTKK